MLGYIYLIIAVIFNSLGLIAFKLAADKSSKFIFLIGIILGLINAYFHTLSLKTLSLVITYPFLVGASTIIILIYNLIFLSDEIITWTNYIGYFCVMFGLFLIFQSK